MKKKKYVQLINQVTTDYKTRIDHIYTNIHTRVKNSGVLESYFSDHKPIFVSLFWFVIDKLSHWKKTITDFTAIYTS